MGGSAEVAALKTLLTQLPLNDYQRLQAVSVHQLVAL